MSWFSRESKLELRIKNSNLPSIKSQEVFYTWLLPFTPTGCAHMCEILKAMHRVSSERGSFMTRRKLGIEPQELGSDWRFPGSLRIFYGFDGLSPGFHISFQDFQDLQDETDK